MPTHPTARAILWAGLASAVFLGLAVATSGCAPARVVIERPYAPRGAVLAPAVLRAGGTGYEPDDDIGKGEVFEAPRVPARLRGRI